MIQKIILKPSRIGCPSIPGTMKGIILSIKGVKEVTVHYESRALDITYEDSEISYQSIIDKIGQEMGLALEVANAKNLMPQDVSQTCPM